MFKIFVLALIIFLSGCGRGTQAVQTSTGNTLSVKKESWGMRRNPPDRPGFTDNQKEMMDKYGCIYLGSSEQKYLYLTFDEGYENGQTAKILDTLKQKGVKAAFFITGDYFKAESALVDRMVEEGHIVGNHTMKHPCMPDIEDDGRLEEEVLSLDRAFYERYNSHMRFFRAPEGAYSEKTLAVTKKLGYTNVFWSFAYDDWYRDKQRGADFAYNKTISNIHPGCVILLHAVSSDNADALGEIIDSAREEGYEFLSLEEYIP